MRKFQLLASLCVALVLAGGGMASAANPVRQQSAPMTSSFDDGADCYCDNCCRGGLFGHHHGCRRGGYEGLDTGFNCGCNGSYKFPVPPLYTYHWPGMWQQVLMTDYHSPWRFPPLKPYADEAVPPAMGIQEGSMLRVRQASASVSVGLQERSSFSRHVESMSR
jgi:hypothetical protein